MPSFFEAASQVRKLSKDSRTPGHSHLLWSDPSTTVPKPPGQASDLGGLSRAASLPGA